jgi:hypothetical protein
MAFDIIRASNTMADGSARIATCVDDIAENGEHLESCKWQRHIANEDVFDSKYSVKE